MYKRQDKDTMLASDHIVDFGPGAGLYGGEIVAQGTPEEILKSDCPTSDYLAGRREIEVPAERRVPQPNQLVLKLSLIHISDRNTDRKL